MILSFPICSRFSRYSSLGPILKSAILLNWIIVTFSLILNFRLNAFYFIFLLILLILRSKKIQHK